MSATINKEQFEYAKRVYTFNETIKAECKVDNLNDCEILSTIPQLATPKVETTDGAIKVYGRLTFFIAYQKEGVIKRLESSAEYSATIKNDQVTSEQSAFVTANVIKCDEYYSTSSLILTATIDLGCDLIKPCKAEFISAGQDVILKTEILPIAKSFGKKQSKITVTEEFELPKLIDEVIYHTENVFVTDCKAGIGSILIDGDCTITSYILQKNSNSDIVKETHTFPFRLEIAEERAMPTMQAIARANVESAKIFVTCYEETGTSTVKAEVELLLVGEAFDTVDTPIAIDAYSTFEELSTLSEELYFEQKHVPVCVTEKFCERINFDELAVGTKIVTAYPNGISNFYTNVLDGKLNIDATIGFTTIFKDENGACFSKQLTLPVSINTDYNVSQNQTASICSFYPTDFNAKQISLGELEVYGAVRFCVYAETTNTVLALIDATVQGEIVPNDNAFSVYIPYKGEDLWSVSKRIGISPDEVVACNPELDFPLTGDERLLVYRQKTKEYT